MSVLKAGKFGLVLVWMLLQALLCCAPAQAATQCPNLTFSHPVGLIGNLPGTDQTVVGNKNTSSCSASGPISLAAGDNTAFRGFLIAIEVQNLSNAQTGHYELRFTSQLYYYTDPSGPLTPNPLVERHDDAATSCTGDAGGCDNLGPSDGYAECVIAEGTLNDIAATDYRTCRISYQYTHLNQTMAVAFDLGAVTPGDIATKAYASDFVVSGGSFNNGAPVVQSPAVYTAHVGATVALEKALQLPHAEPKAYETIAGMKATSIWVTLGLNVKQLKFDNLNK